jgi:PEP-CTERM motif
MVISDHAGDFFSTYYGFNGFSPDYPISGTWQFAGSGITEIDFGSSNFQGGITSISYTLDRASMPEPSSLMFLGMGLTALIGLVRRGGTKVQQAML